MIQASLIAFLRTGNLGPFAAHCSRDAVLKTLGSPTYWDGGKTFEKSTIWVYDSVQFNFDEQMRLEDIHVGFESTFDGTAVNYSDWNNNFIRFVDLDIETISMPARFRSTMVTNQIGTTEHSLSVGRMVINTDAGVQARFSRVTAFQASMEAERRIATNEPYLHRITTVILKR